MLKHLVRAAVLAAAVFALPDLSPARAPGGAAKIRVLIIDGQNNHDWRATTPLMKKELEACGRFTVDVATTPQPPASLPRPKQQQWLREQMETFHPDLSKCDVVLLNYNGQRWGKAFQKDFTNAVRAGKVGVVVVHAANNSFGGGWDDYNHMIGMGWYSPSVGPRLYLDESGKEVLVPKGKGDGPGHRYTGEFAVTIRDASHPVTQGMPPEWKHARDELYDNMRGPIENVRVLATAYSKGTSKNEPMIWTVAYGKGRVFHTPMGHDTTAMRCVGFITTLRRGTEWAATSSVTLPIPENFPTAAKSSSVPTK
jgi:type 1 glutamine amidotransferase